jgi:hypothetical protein
MGINVFKYKVISSRGGILRRIGGALLASFSPIDPKMFSFMLTSTFS